VYDKKKKDGHTVVKLHPVENRNYTILQGNNEEIQLPDDLEIDTIFTSPPYYKLVKYGDDPNELGWEKTPDLYVKRLSDILIKGYEKLKDTGSMFVNLGESYEDSEFKYSPSLDNDSLKLSLFSFPASWPEKKYQAA